MHPRATIHNPDPVAEQVTDHVTVQVTVQVTEQVAGRSPGANREGSFGTQSALIRHQVDDQVASPNTTVKRLPRLSGPPLTSTVALWRRAISSTIARPRPQPSPPSLGRR
ncbi:MAG: hypothetical protein JWM63_3482 [Gammaproteobacteria bacterium]|nr:hypothetical protein [Gammaproteobacteria bacterium]